MTNRKLLSGSKKHTAIGGIHHQFTGFDMFGKFQPDVVVGGVEANVIALEGAKNDGQTLGGSFPVPAFELGKSAIIDHANHELEIDG